MRLHSSRPSSSKEVLGGFVVLIVLGLASFVIGGYQFVEKQRFLNSAEITTGTVVSNELDIDPSGKSQICPKIRFSTKTGQSISYLGGECASDPVYSIGSTVQVYYNPDDPTQPRTGTGAQYETALFAFGMGILFFFIALIMFFSARSKSRREMGTNTKVEELYRKAGISEEEYKQRFLNQRKK